MSVIRLTTRVERLWAEYLEARDRAERTGSIEDGIAAGRAWSAWLHLFMTPDQKRVLPDVIEARR